MDGQPVLVPTLYLAESSKIEANGATIASGGNTSLSASSVTNVNGRITVTADYSDSALIDTG